MALPVSRLVRQLGRSTTPPDAELLRRYADATDAEAFAELVRRHGPMVLAACRRVLHDAHAAEDAFQAVFFALARRPGSVRNPAALPAWLHGTAVRTALRLRRAARRSEPVHGSAAPEPDPAAVAAERDRLGALDEELARLPDRLRLPLVLCYLDGQTRDEAAEALGCSLAMLKRRLERGRHLLRDRLARRGVTLPAAGLGVLATDLALSAHVEAACVAAGQAPATAAVLGSGWVKAAILVAGLVACGVGLVAAGVRPDEERPTTTHTDPPIPPKAAARTDRFGDALPPGVLTRLGTARHRAAGAHVAVTPDSKTVVTAGDNLVVRTFDAATGDTRETRTLDGPPTYHTTLSADGRYLAGVAYPTPGAAELRVWDLTTGKPAGRLPLGHDPATALAIHSDTKKLAFIRGPYTQPPTPQKTCLWDFAADAEPVELRSFERAKQTYGEPRTLFSADGSKLLAHQLDGRLVCWEVGGQKVLWEKPLPYLKFFLFSPDGKRVVLNTGGTGFEVWSAADGAKVDGAGWDGKGVRNAHEYWPVAASPDGGLIALFHGQRQVVFYNTLSKAIVRELNDPLREPGEAAVGFWAVPTNFAFTPNGTGFVWRSPTVQRWSVATGKATWPATWDQGHTEAVTRLLFVPGRNMLVSAAADSTYYVWDLARGRPLHRLPKGLGQLAAVSPDGRTLFTGSAGFRSPLKAWDLTSAKEALTLKGDASFPQYGSSGDREAAVTPDGKQLVTLTDNHTLNERIPVGRCLTVWDLATAKVAREENVGPREDDTVIAPSGDVYATASRNGPDRSIRLVATATGKEVGRLADRDLAGNAASGRTLESAFSPDGRMLATRVNDDGGTARSVGDRPVKVWDVATGRSLAHFPAAGPVRFAFAPDGRTLVVAGTDGFRVYEMTTRKEVHAVAVTGVPRGRKPGPFATALAVGPGGRTVATGHDDGTVLIWDATLPRVAIKPAEVDAAWKALADPDAKAGRAAVLRLADAPDLAVGLFGDRLKPAVVAPGAAALVRRLDADEFRDREAAEKELRALGGRAAPALTAALAGQPSGELRDRAGRLLAALSMAVPSGEDLRGVRAVEVLEGIGTPASRQLLDRLATGDPVIRLTREAKAALSRLGGQ